MLLLKTSIKINQIFNKKLKILEILNFKYLF